MLLPSIVSSLASFVSSAVTDRLYSDASQNVPCNDNGSQVSYSNPSLGTSTRDNVNSVANSYATALRMPNPEDYAIAASPIAHSNITGGKMSGSTQQAVAADFASQAALHSKFWGQGPLTITSFTADPQSPQHSPYPGHGLASAGLPVNKHLPYPEKTPSPSFWCPDPCEDPMIRELPTGTRPPSCESSFEEEQSSNLFSSRL